MKPSHERTPRTLNDCTFTPGYVSSDFNNAHSAPTTIKLVAGALLAVTLLLMYAN